jgi:hypothetical protein
VEIYYSRDRIHMRVPKRDAGVTGMNIEVIIPEGRTSD